MYMLKNIITFIALVSQCSVLSQYGEIKGQVFDQDDTAPFAIVHVMVGDEKIGTAADIDGQFTIKPLLPGSYSLTVLWLGQTIVIDNVIVKVDQITFLGHLEMPELPCMCDPYPPNFPELFNRLQPEIKRWKGKGIKHLAVDIRTDILPLFETFSSRITVTEIVTENVHIKGSRNRDILYNIDGVKLNNTSPILPRAAISEITIFAGSIPAKFGDTTGGVILIETKSYMEQFYEWKSNNW